MVRFVSVVAFLLTVGCTDGLFADSLPTDSIPAPDPPDIPELKSLHRSTVLVRANIAETAIVVPTSGEYDREARRIQHTIQDLTGVSVPIVHDLSPAAEVPLTGNIIALGNRSTNELISRLYNRYYTLLDLKYPGPGGYVIRSLHDPFGNGYNALLVGASKPSGVAQAADRFAEHLREAADSRSHLTLGWTWDIQLSEQYEIPENIDDVPHWGESPGFGLRGNFGWNAISRAMALYYMTGDDEYAREVIRLTFPDERAKEQLFEWDNRAFQNLDDPLAGLHHYYAHMSIFYWDLIEESPAFSDGERLEITRSFARQLDARKGEGIYELTEPPPYVGGRHQQYSAFTLFCLSRYFVKYYPDPVWEQAFRASKYNFEALHSSTWVGNTEAENMYFYGSYLAPTINYLLLTGDRKPMENGVVPHILEAHEMLITGQGSMEEGTRQLPHNPDPVTITDRQPSWPLWYTSHLYLSKIAYLTGDGQWLEYRDRLGLDTDKFRLGQSFYPADTTPSPPSHLVGKWSINPAPPKFWQKKIPGSVVEEEPLEELFLWGSFRSTPDGSGDFILLDGHDGGSRNPQHAFALIELRIDGQTILQDESTTRQGHYNQVTVKADGLVGPQVPRNSALRHHDVLGQTAIATVEVPEKHVATWNRTIAQHIGEYALVVDKATFQTTGDRMEVQTQWHAKEPKWNAERQTLYATPTVTAGTAPPAEIHPADVMPVSIEDDVATMSWTGSGEPGDEWIGFSLVTPGAGDPEIQYACLRLDDSAAALELPSPGLAVSGQYRSVQGELVILTGEHLFGRQIERVELGEHVLTASEPIDVDWNFGSGELVISASASAAVRITEQGESTDSAHRRIIRLSRGEKTLTDVHPPKELRNQLRNRLADLVEIGRKQEQQSIEAQKRSGELSGGALAPVWTAQIPDAPTAVVATDSSGDIPYLFAAENERIHPVRAGGSVMTPIAVPGPLRVLHWWPEAKTSTGHPLLVAGDTEEHVTALTPDGSREWMFTSEMDPALVATGQRQWFKESRPGIFGLGSGPFMDDREQLFVGSTTTLEILNPDGSLAERLPTFWGAGSVFQLIDGPTNTRNLLIARRRAGRATLTILNSDTLDPSPRGFYDVPDGHTSIQAWAKFGRRHIFYEDMDGDGTREIASEINGTWNRVSIWKEDGTPLYNVNLGPGKATPYPNIRDFTVTNFDGDETKEIVVGTDDGYLILLDHSLDAIWSKKLESSPSAFAAVSISETERALVVGCKDGTILVFDYNGNIIRHGTVDGQPTHVATPHAGENGAVIFATDTGQIAEFQVAK